MAFLRIRNREGYDVYFRPFAGDHNAGYLLLDLDHPVPGLLARLRAQGHEPSVVVETSPGRWQAWIRVSPQPLRPELATRVAKRLAQIYAADPASADWRHLGRLVGFTNRKPGRRLANGLAPWVKLIDARAGLARNWAALLERAAAELAGPRGHSPPVSRSQPPISMPTHSRPGIGTVCIDCASGNAIRPPTGASRIDGLPANSSLPAQIPPWSLQCSATAAQAFRVAMPIPRITCVELLRCAARFSRAPHPTLLPSTDSAPRAPCVLNARGVGYLAS